MKSWDNFGADTAENGRQKGLKRVALYKASTVSFLVMEISDTE